MRFRIHVILLIGFAGAQGGQAEDAVLLARFARDGAAMVRVLGVDGEQRLRLVPIDDPRGEALMPLTEAKGLQFVLPSEFAEARNRVEAGRAAEAVFLLRQVGPRLVPYAGIAESNAAAAVRFYLRLLMAEAHWAEALAVVRALPLESGDGEDLAGPALRLAQALLATDRVSDAMAVWERLPLAQLESDRRREAEGFADALRRAARWPEAEAAYARLRATLTPEAVPTGGRRLDALITHARWQQDRRDHLTSFLRDELAPVGSDTGALQRLLGGWSALENDDPSTALDLLSEALVNLGSASEWKTEITVALAAAYRAADRSEVADRIEAGLARDAPDFSWPQPSIPPRSPPS